MFEKHEKTDRNKFNSFLPASIIIGVCLTIISKNYTNIPKYSPKLTNHTTLVVPWNFENKKDSTPHDIVHNGVPKIKTKADLYRYMIGAKIKFPELVWSQAMLESQWMSSDLFSRSNNLFGMTKSEQRPNVQIHIRGERYSHFESIRQSVNDYNMHQTFVLRADNIKTEAGYLKRLESTGYAKDKKYRRKLLTIRDTTDFKSLLNVE